MSASNTSARKARDFASREELILREARRFLLERGFQGWNMDDLAQTVEYSKGTLYQHFVSKEDLALGVATQALTLRADMFDRAAAFKGGTRERARAIGMACCQFAISCPEYLQVDFLLKEGSFRDKASEQRRLSHDQQGMRCWRAIYTIIVEAMALGDMPRSPWTAEEATFALIATTVGSHMMSQETPIQVFAGITNGFASIRKNQDLICDGLGWRPLLRDFDFSEVDERIVREVFPEASAWLRPT
jgi:AcrR family transcriptional regulator